MRRSWYNKSLQNGLILPLYSGDEYFYEILNIKPPEISTGKNLKFPSLAVIVTENPCIVIIIHSNTLGTQ
jgi:hypothetical protein